LIIDVTALPSGGSNWNVRVFEHLNGSRYALHEETCIVLRGVWDFLRSYAAYAAFASTRGLRNSSHHWRKVVGVLESGVRGSAVSSP